MLFKTKKKLMAIGVAAVTTGTALGIALPIVLNKNDDSSSVSYLSKDSVAYEILVGKTTASGLNNTDTDDLVKAFATEMVPANSSATFTLNKDKVQYNVGENVVTLQYEVLDKDGKVEKTVKVSFDVSNTKTKTTVISVEYKDATKEGKVEGTTDTSGAVTYKDEKGAAITAGTVFVAIDHLNKSVHVINIDYVEIIAIEKVLKSITHDEVKKALLIEAKKVGAQDGDISKMYPSDLSTAVNGSFTFDKNSKTVTVTLKNVHPDNAKGKLSYKYEISIGTRKKVEATSHEITGFKIQTGYEISINSGSATKVSDQISASDIDHSKLPNGVSIKSVATSKTTTDGTTVTVTFTSGTILTQELGGFTSYLDKGGSLTKSIVAADFTKAITAITDQAKTYPTDAAMQTALKNALLPLIQAKITGLNTAAETAIKALITTANITLVPNKEEGELGIEVKVGNHSLTTPITITGFRAYKEVGLAASITSQDILTAISTAATVSNTANASAYTAPTTVNVTKGGETFTLSVTNPVVDDNDGEITFDIAITSPSYSTDPLLLDSASQKVVLTGFKTNLTDKQKIDKIQTELDALSLPLSFSGTKLVNKNLVNQNALQLGTIVTNAYGISPTANSIVPNNDGSVTFNIEYTAGGHKATKTITISGVFETETEIAQKLIDDIADNQTGVTLPTKKGTAITTYFGATPTASDFTPPTVSDPKITFTFKTATGISSSGTTRVTYEVSSSVSGTTPKNVSFSVAGFESRADSVIRLAQAVIDTIASHKTGVTPPTKKGSRPTTQNGETPLAGDVTPPTSTTSSIRFTYKSATAIDSDGKSSMTYEVSSTVSGTTTKDVVFDVSGFETAAEKTTRDAAGALTAANKKIADVVKDGTLTQPTKKPGASVNNGDKPQASDFTPPVKAGISFTFKSAGAVNRNGDSRVIYIMDVDPAVQGTTKRDFDFDVSGFETLAQKTLREADAKIQDVTTSTTTNVTKKTSVHHGNKPTAGDITPPTQQGVKFTFKSATVVDDNGESKVTYEVDVKPTVSGTTKKQLEYTVTGFETLAQKTTREANAAKLEAVAIIDQLNPANFSSVFDKSKLSSDSSQVANSIKQAIVAAIKAKMTASTPASKALITKALITFTPTDGQMVFEINKADASLGGSGTKSITITGFLTLTQQTQTALNDEQTRINALTSTTPVTATSATNAAVVPAGTAFDTTIATSYGIDFTGFDAATYTYTYEQAAGVAGPVVIKITAKVTADTSLSSTPAPADITITFAS